MADSSKVVELTNQGRKNRLFEKRTRYAGDPLVRHTAEPHCLAALRGCTTLSQWVSQLLYSFAYEVYIHTASMARRMKQSPFFSS